MGALTMPHIIRLRGPWNLEPLARTGLRADGTLVDLGGPLPSACRTTVPSDWGELLGVDFRGRVLYSRRFHQPTGMAEIERIDLVIEQVDALGDVWLNGRLLGEIPLGFVGFRTEIKERLERYNLLEVQVECPEWMNDVTGEPRGQRTGLPGGLVGEVLLEITHRET
ncbi:MAG: hypothetical protein EA424_22385 [Planctomycetaceae bacterium]|nr:MAG: hypothetical protein EA424_22385 [Planctomycetaceae bacterium]